MRRWAKGGKLSRDKKKQMYLFKCSFSSIQGNLKESYVIFNAKFKAPLRHSVKQISSRHEAVDSLVSDLFLCTILTHLVNVFVHIHMQ